MRVQKLRACREAPGGNALIENDGLLRGTIAEENSPVDADTVSRPVRNAGISALFLTPLEIGKPVAIDVHHGPLLGCGIGHGGDIGLDVLTDLSRAQGV